MLYKIQNFLGFNKDTLLVINNSDNITVYEPYFIILNENITDFFKFNLISTFI